MRYCVPAARLFCAALCTAVLGGCATVESPVKRDPWEAYNRGVFAVNERIDEYALKPTAKAYNAVLPQVVRTGVSNFFSNLGDVAIGVNNVLQGKVGDGASDLGRFLLNSTVGIVGLFDVASKFGMDKHNEDFGQTLGRWGLDGGPYFVLPVFGPSTVRDTFGRVVDSPMGYSPYINDTGVRAGVLVLDGVNTRANLLSATSVVEEAALDKYQFIRDAYLKRRLNLVYDGKPPQEKMDALEDDEPVGTAIKPGGRDDVPPKDKSAKEASPAEKK